MRLPRPQFTVLSLLRTIAAVAIVLAVLIARPREHWLDIEKISLEFMVLDDSTGKPVAGASLRLRFRLYDYAATTNAQGRVRIVVEGACGGGPLPSRTTRRVNHEGELVVAADRFPLQGADLRNLTRDPRYHSDKAPPPIVIRLAKLRLDGDQ